MGYTTEFSGEFNVSPPLNRAEIAYLTKFADTRRMDRRAGPYFVGENEDDVINSNMPPKGQPGLWCQWIPNDTGDKIRWDTGEKFYHADRWIIYILDHFLRPEAEASKTDDPQFADFTFDHVVNGTVEAQGERAHDRWRIVVSDNVVDVQNRSFESWI
jgi:hypothetical protein